MNILLATFSECFFSYWSVYLGPSSFVSPCVFRSFTSPWMRSGDSKNIKTIQRSVSLLEYFVGFGIQDEDGDIYQFFISTDCSWNGTGAAKTQHIFVVAKWGIFQIAADTLVLSGFMVFFRRAVGLEVDFIVSHARFCIPVKTLAALECFKLFEKRSEVLKFIFYRGAIGLFLRNIPYSCSWQTLIILK